LTAAAPALADEAAVTDGMQASLDFADNNWGIILPQPLDETVFHAVTVIDTRSANQVAAGTIAGARF